MSSSDDNITIDITDKIFNKSGTLNSEIINYDSNTEQESNIESENADEESITSDMYFKTENDNSKKDNYISWLTKYQPAHFDDCYLKSDDRNLIERWIKCIINPDLLSEIKIKSTSKKKKIPEDTNCLFLHGPPGLGKTTIANLLFKKYNFDVLEFNASDSRTAKVIQDKLHKIGGSHNVIDFMCNKKRKIAIILDEIDGLSTGDKGGMTEINNVIADSRKNNTPFICISNTVSKKTDSLKRKSLYIKLHKTSEFHLTKLVNKIVNEESIENISNNILRKIVSKSQGDIRRCITMLEYFFRDDNNDNLFNRNKCVAGGDSESEYQELNHEMCMNNIKRKTVSEEDIENYSRKRTELAPYEICEKILNSFKNLEFFLDNFNYDNSMMNWYIYENFIKYIEKNRIGSFKQKLVNISNIYDGFIIGDILEKEMISRQNFTLNEYINIFKTYNSSYWSNESLKKLTYNKMGMMNYSTLLNKTSLEYLNSKNWNMVNSKLNTFTDTNITLILCDIIYKYFENENTEFLISLINKNNISKDELEKIIKLSTYYNKNSNLSKLKKKINLLYINA